MKEIRMVRRIEPEPMEFDEEIEVVKWLWKNKPQEIVEQAEEEGISPVEMAEEMAEGLIREGIRWKRKEWQYFEGDDEEHQVLEEEKVPSEEGWQDVVTKRMAKRRRYEANKVTRRWGTKKAKEVPKEKVNYFRTVEQEGIMQVQGEWE